jgi:putative tricarboxylic transport membrane protein
MVTRRACILAGLGAAAPAFALAAAPTAASALAKLKIYIPAGAGGGWDQTGRGIGAAMQASNLVREIEYENKGGKGGTIGLADFVQRYRSDPHALLVGGLVMLGALARDKNESALKDVSPIARLTSDYLVLAAAPDSKIKTFQDLADALHKDAGSVTFTGGSAGGVDHMLSAMLLRALKVDAAGLKYQPTASGKEALEALKTGKATVAVSGYSEFKSGIESKAVVPLAVSSKRSLFGLKSLRELGADTELANWRGVFAPAGIKPEQKDLLRSIVVRATESSTWKQTLLENDWVGSLLYGRDLQKFIEFEQGVVGVVTSMLKLHN